MKTVFSITILLLSLLMGASVQANENNPAAIDKRPVLLINSKDMHDRRRGDHKNANDDGYLKSFSDMVEGVLAELNIYRIITDNAIGRSVQDEELFKFLSGDDSKKEMKITVPGYRLELDLMQCSVQMHDKKSSSVATIGHGRGKKRRMEPVVAVHHTKKRKAVVEILFKIYDISTQTTIFSEKITRVKEDESISSAVAGSQMRHHKGGKMLDDADSLLSLAADEVMHELSERLKDSQTYHIVGCSDDAILTLDAPSGVVAPGDVMKVMSLGRTAASKKTGKKIRSETQVATIRVTASNDEGATAEFIEINDPDCDWHVVVRRSRELTAKMAGNTKKPFSHRILRDIRDARNEASVEQFFGKEYDYRRGKVALDGVGGRPCRVVAAIHSCRSAGIHGAEGASRRVVSTENAQRRRACSYGSRSTRGVVTDVETA